MDKMSQRYSLYFLSICFKTIETFGRTSSNIHKMTLYPAYRTAYNFVQNKQSYFFIQMKYKYKEV